MYNNERNILNRVKISLQNSNFVTYLNSFASENIYVHTSEISDRIINLIYGSSYDLGR